MTGSIPGKAESLLTRYGRSEEDNQAICELLREEVDRESGLSYLDFWPSGRGIHIFFTDDGVTSGCSLDDFIPYLGALDAAGLVHLIRESALGKGHGECPLYFDNDEMRFLEERAVPTIADAKIRQMREDGTNLIEFGITCFGIGYYGGESGWLAEVLLKHLKERTDFDGLIRLTCVGFDVDFFVIHSAWEYIEGGLRSAVHTSGMSGRVEVTYDRFWGDLTNPTLLPSILAYGRPDFSLWRRTHIIANRLAPVSHGHRIIDGMRRNLNRPGALVVHEHVPPPNEGELYIQELV